jgi:hypothetical protein
MKMIPDALRGPGAAWFCLPTVASSNQQRSKPRSEASDRPKFLVWTYRGGRGGIQHSLQDPTKDNGYIESLDKHVAPRSLYLTQLRERLGEAAVRNIAASGQIVFG